MMSDTGQSENTEKRSSNLPVKWLLMGSLAVNLLLVGLIGGAVWSGHSGGAVRDFKAHFMGTLSPVKRTEVDRIFKSHNQNIRPHRREVRQKVRRLMQMLRADDFNRSAVDALLDDLARTRGELVKKRYKMIADIAEQLTPDERRRFIRQWRRHMRKMRRHRRRMRRQYHREQGEHFGRPGRRERGEYYDRPNRRERDEPFGRPFPRDHDQAPGMPGGPKRKAKEI